MSDEDSTNGSEEVEEANTGNGELSEENKEFLTGILGLPMAEDDNFINLLSEDDKGNHIQTLQTADQKHCSPTPGPSGLKRTQSNSSLPESYAIPPIEAQNNPWSPKHARHSY